MFGIIWAVLKAVIIGPFIWTYIAFKALGKMWRGAKKGHGLIKSLDKQISCGQGCPPMDADGIWECSKCGGKRKGWVWKDCPFCGASTTHVDCETCGISIKNPKVVL
jgi:RecJ-like exonuclease